MAVIVLCSNVLSRCDRARTYTDEQGILAQTRVQIEVNDRNNFGEKIHKKEAEETGAEAEGGGERTQKEREYANARNEAMVCSPEGPVRYSASCSLKAPLTLPRPIVTSVLMPLLLLRHTIRLCV